MSSPTFSNLNDYIGIEVKKYLALFLIIFALTEFLSADNGNHKKNYRLLDAEIDVVIVSHPKDKDTIDLCIEGIRENCPLVRRVIVVSSHRLTKNAEWFDEKQYPFSKNDVFLKIGRGSKKKAEAYFNQSGRPVGWFYQQLLKLYAPLVIPNISPNVLVIDADTVFLNPVTFLNEVNGGLFCMSSLPAKRRYLDHAKRLVPGYERVYPEVYSVCHHMLFQKPILKDLFKKVEKFHKTSFWKAFCLCVDLDERKGASEYEIYYNFALRNTDQVELRPLHWKNSPTLDQISIFKAEGYQFVSFHTYLRK